MSETYRTEPSLCETVRRSKELHDSEFLNPPADFPALFTCRYRGAVSVGAIFRNGIVFVVPDLPTYDAGPACFANLGAAERSGEVTDIVWEWGVVRLCDEPLISPAEGLSCPS